MPCFNRVDAIEITPVADGYIIYHPTRDRLHYLNHTAAIVFECCDGTNDEDTIAQMLGAVYDLPDVPRDEVTTVLTLLVDEQLVC